MSPDYLSEEGLAEFEEIEVPFSIIVLLFILLSISVADPGFSIGGCAPVRGGRGPPMWALFGENVCENERIGSHRGGMHWAHPP